MGSQRIYTNIDATVELQRCYEKLWSVRLFVIYNNIENVISSRAYHRCWHERPTLAQQLKKNNVSFTVFERDLSNDSRSQSWALSLFREAYDLMKTLMPSELGPVEQTIHLLLLDLPP